MTQAEAHTYLLNRGFTYLGLCGTCGNRYKDYVNDRVQVKIAVKQDYMKLYVDGIQKTYGYIYEIETKLNEHTPQTLP